MPPPVHPSISKYSGKSFLEGLRRRKLLLCAGKRGLGNKIAAVQTDSNDKPLEDVVIDTIRVETAGKTYTVEKIGE